MTITWVIPGWALAAELLILGGLSAYLIGSGLWDRKKK